ncbi:zinc finger CCCH domain-containing protein 19-like [Canna indica]|uniref:Zinc finger CCCH domain-containing protein 19-like n=1 Tax=Canna indica TaxID=4628 RepID=A0AAQ3QN02_9LILI|nr:zinc finger CCCH domain-containing protein 19-like [Canna indica]
MEEREGDNTSAVVEPYPSRPPGDENPLPEAVEAGPTQCGQAEREREAGYSPVPQGSSSASHSSGCDAGAPEVAALELVVGAVSSVDGDADEQAAAAVAEEPDEKVIPQFELAAGGGKAEVSVPQGSAAAYPSCVDGGDEKVIASDVDAGNIAVVGAGLLEEEAPLIGMEETENSQILKWEQVKNGVQEEVSTPQGSPVVSPSGSDDGIKQFAAFESSTITLMAGDDAVSVANEEMLKVDASISTWQQRKDSEQEEVLMPQGSPAFFPSGSDSSLPKFVVLEIDSTTAIAGDVDPVEQTMNVDSGPTSQVEQEMNGVQEDILMPESSSAISPSGSDGVLLKFASSESATAITTAVDGNAAELAVPKMDVNSASTLARIQVDCTEADYSPSSSDRGHEKLLTCEPDAIATSCYDDDDASKEVAFSDVNNLDNLSLSLPEPMDDVKDEETVIHQGSPSELPSDSDRGVHKISAIDTVTVTISHESADVIDDEQTQMDVEADEVPAVVRRGGGRRKRGRPAKGQVARTTSRRKDEEDVCFICFDGGDLVVCDRRGCPKVYHPSCVNRDEAFFRAKGRWSCGWHICSSCEKSAHYMCFTCTHSLCKGCFKDSGFICVREKKGFCETCMGTVMLIETNEHGNKTMVGVDFDDRTSFEYLFKDYWLSLKAKSSLTLEELMIARNPIKKSDIATGNDESSDDLLTAKEEQAASSDSSSEHKEERISSKRKLRKRSKNAVNEEGSVKDIDNAGKSVSKDFDWASEELLAFVAHMRNGDKTPLSQFDVQGLLLEYIKQEGLRDPRKKSQIVCDPMLESLFGKSRVGHFEMLKLLESHFITKEVSPMETEEKQGGVVDPDLDSTDAKGQSDSSTKITPDKRRRTRKKVEREVLSNLDDYAAIDVHNISLMYLRRNLMEELIDDESSLDEKVIGSFVRIRISGVGQRQDMYRLVQVVGTSKTTERYKSGKKTTDVTLEILNLNKKENITIDIISNQDFTEEECKRLRQSIKCGFIDRLTVGDVQEKARFLQEVRVKDWLESEKLRLGHLRDRASEKGRRKELRVCVEKLQLLNTPEERKRRLNEVPEIHVDPHMDPDYESAEEEEESDMRKKDYYDRSRGSSFLRNGREVKSPGKGGSALSDSWGSLRKNSNTWESNRSTLIEGASIADSSARGVETNEFLSNQTSSPKDPKNHVLGSASDPSLYNEKQHIIRPEQSSDGPQGNQKTSLQGGLQVLSNTSESDKIWHYKDPSGKIQGPFSMMQLRKWNTTGYFPPNLRIWRTSEKQDDSILLTDALVGKFEKDLPEWVPPLKSTPQQAVTSPTVFSAEKNSDVWRGNNDAASSNSKQNAQKGSVGQNEKWATSGERISPMEVNVKFVQAQGTNTTFLSSPSSQHLENPHNWSSTSHQLSNNTLKVEPANDSSYQWRNDSSIMSTPTSQSRSKDWSIPDGSSSKHLPSSASAQDMNSSWVKLTRGREEPESSFPIDEPTRTTSNSFRELGSGSARCLVDQTVISDGRKFLPVASLSARDTVFSGQSNEIDAMSNFQGRNSVHESSANLENQRALVLPLKDEMNQQTNQSSENKVILTQEQEASQILPSAYNQLATSRLGNNPVKELLRTHDKSSDGSDPNKSSVIDAHIGTSIASASFNSERPGFLLESSVLSENPREKTNVTEMENISPAQNLDTCPTDMVTNLFVQPDASEPSSSQRLQTSIAPNSELYNSGSEPMHPANFDVSTHVTSNNNSIQAAHHVISYGWKSVAGSTPVSNESVQLLPSDGSNPSFSSQFVGNAAILPVQPTHLGFSSGSSIHNANFPVDPQNPSPNSGPAQGTGNMNWTPTPQGNMNVGWGMVGQGNMNMPWGQPAQAIANMNMGLGGQNQVNIMNPGWVAPAQGNTNMNVGWATPPIGNTNQTIGWGGQLQGSFPVNPVWTMLLPGQTNPGPGWVGPVPPNTNQNWETPNQNMNVNTVWGTGQGNMNPSMNSSAGNPLSLNNQPPSSGDRRSSQGDNGRVSDPGQLNRRPSWNRMQPGGGSSGPPRGQSGICKFHEMGHCKKGASCNYFHP